MPPPLEPEVQAPEVTDSSEPSDPAFEDLYAWAMNRRLDDTNQAPELLFGPGTERPL